MQRKYTSYILLVFFSIGLFKAGSVSAQQSILIYLHHFPPYHILKGEKAGTGAIDQVLREIEGKYKEKYKLEYIGSSFSRFHYDMQNGKKGCNFAIRKTKERSDYLDFSIPYIITYGNGLITHKKNYNQLKKYIDKNGSLNLEDAVASKLLTIFAQKKRRYSDVIDKVVDNKEYIMDNRVHLFSQKNQMEANFQVIRRSGIIAHIGYPTEAKYFAQKFNLDESVIFIPINHSEKFTFGYLACSKGDWNKAFMTDMDAFFKEYRHSERLISILVDSIPENIEDDFREIIANTFGK